MSERDGFQYLLPSGRGVRLVELRPSEKDQITKNAAKLVGRDGTVADFRVVEVHEGICKMLKEVTKKTHEKTDDLLKKELWKEVDPGDLEDHYDDYFTAKDDAVLSSLYRRLHEVSMDEIEAIALKALPVSS